VDLAFYNAAPSTGPLARLAGPARRLVRRLQRPYYHRLRDLLTQLFHTQEGAQRRMDDLSAQCREIDQHARVRDGELAEAIRDLRRVVTELAARPVPVPVMAPPPPPPAAVKCPCPISPAQLQAVAVDYTALARRLVVLEDLLLDIQAGATSAADADGSSTDSIPMYPGVRRQAS
jgi:hypothetical protein